MITYPTDSDTPPRSAYQTEPWEDEATKTKWLYQPTANRWVPYVVGGAELTSYVEQVASLDDYPSAFPPDTTGLALTARTDGVPDAIIPADAKTTPIDADETILRDSAVAGVPTKRLTFANLWAWIKSKASATFSDGEVMKWGSTADATLQNLGGGTAGRAVFGAATKADAATAAGLGTTDAVTLSTLNVGQITSSVGIRDSSSFNGSIDAYVTTGLVGSHIASRRSVSVVLDWDNNSTSEKFAVFANGFYLSTGELFAVPETGPVTALNGLSTSGTLSVTGVSTLGRLAATIPNYADDAAADADTELLPGQLYRVGGGRAVYQKP
jgi:hypothetical protein